MFEALRRFIHDVSSAQGGVHGGAPEFADDDYRLATAALLVHVANVDGRIGLPERTRLRTVIEERFGLDGAATVRLIARAEETDREAVDFFHFSNVLKRSLDDIGRHRIIAMMWEVVFADGDVSEFEENVVWRVSELLGVPNRDRIALRQEAAEEPAPDEGPSEGPWSPGGKGA